MEYTTKNFATELNCSVRTLEDWRSKRSMKLLPARYDGRKAIYTSEQIPIARKLLCREGLSNNLFPDLDREETAADVRADSVSANLPDICPESATAEQSSPMSDAEFDSNGDSSGDSEYTDETTQDFQSTFDTPAHAEDNHFGELILELPAVESLRAADSDDDSAGKTASNKAPQRFSEKSAFDPEGFFAITQPAPDVDSEPAPEKIAPDAHADFVPQDSNEQGEIGGVYFNATGAVKNNSVVEELNGKNETPADVDSEHVDFLIDDEFKNLIPPLSPNEFKRLEENILSDGGIQNPLNIWQGILIDGHNRYRIAQEHGLPFKTVEMQFDSRDDVKIWIIKNQFGRRNLSAYDRSLLALKLKPVIAAKAKEKQIEAGGAVRQKSDKAVVDTKKEVAKMAGVSHDTIAKVEKIEEKATPEIKAALKAGEISINQGYQQVKRAEKKSQIIKAQADIVAQRSNSQNPAVLFVGNGINFVPDEPYKLLLTDPPYSTDVEDIKSFAESWLPNALRHVRRDGFAYVFIGAYSDELCAYLSIKPPENLLKSQVLVWTYKNTLGQAPKNYYIQNWQACLFYRGVDAPALNCPITNEQWAVQDINAPDGRLGNRYHSWQKPDEIAERFIRHSTQAGDIVFDPFACTGTFLLAAAKLGRKAYGFEINPDNAKIAFGRGCENGGDKKIMP